MATAVLFELTQLCWLLPLLRLGGRASARPHPALLPTGDVAPGWIALVVGCAGAFAAGFAGVHLLLQSVCKPLWLAGRGARLRQEQLAQEKERLYLEFTLAKHQLSRLQHAVKR